ncbi:glycosyltransferase family 2 protein [Bordetella petrii]|uniref:glycosyltransferase family 2 protein n=1 Tax=Bordetella petrii TaxID=94624 RepID=UPI001A97189B|nr:glycosyltransferase family 2 protein [Bordetella petrii]MBO1114244.1 glycosyltransferase family 2 protein [Bordetella petrii]
MSEFFQLLVQGAQIVVLAIIATGVAQDLVYLLQLCIVAAPRDKTDGAGSADELWQRYGDVCPPIALLVPAYNEQASIADSVKALLSLRYPNIEVIVINDGSRDGTMDVLKSAFHLDALKRSYEPTVPHAAIRQVYGSPLHANLVVIDKQNGGKADALNAGINLSRAPLFCAIDADSLIEPDALLRVVQPFIDRPSRTVAVGGTVRVANGCRIAGGQVVEIRAPRKLLPLFQAVEYLRAFLIARVAWSRAGALTLISGAFGMFRRDIVMAVGGYSLGTVGEDLELGFKIHRRMLDEQRDYEIVFLPEPVCWTEVPESLAVLGRQRSRWQRGALEAFFKHRNMLFHPRYGRIGSLGLGHVLLVDVLGPPIEMAGYILLPLLWASGWLSVDYLLAFLGLTFAFGTFVSIASLVLSEIGLRRYPAEQDLLRLALGALLENFGYRQLSNLWRLRGWWQFLRGEQSWGAMTRVGFRRD